jgi:hypothetical protein
MNSDYDKKLEMAISRALAELPEPPAPPTLVSRVLTAIEARARLPWYRQSWQAWPVSLQTASLVSLLIVFGAICYAGSQAGQTEVLIHGVHKLGGWLTAVMAFSHALNVLAGTIVLAIKHLGPAFIVACLLAAAMGYAFCVGLGTVYFRIALARR